MPVDRRKSWRVAERHLKQGDVQAALNEIQKMAFGARDDLQTLNRLGDLLARQGRRGEAIEYYARIAAQFEEGGFLPKAIAMHKKIVRLDPQHLESVVRLGELNLQRDLLGEARNYLLHAANQFLEAKQFDRAQAIYERLAEAQPDDPRHQVRLAETRAARGDSEAAGRELVAVGDSLLGTGDAAEAERIYARAAELMPTAEEPIRGLSRCLGQQGRVAEAVTLLEQTLGKAGASPALTGELALLYEREGRVDAAWKLLEDSRGVEIPAAVLQQIGRGHLDRGETEVLWQRVDGLLADRASQEDGRAFAAALLEALCDIEAAGHVPALERLAELRERSGDNRGAAQVQKRLAAAHEARKDGAAASRARERLGQLEPEVVATGQEAAPTAAPAASAAEAARLPTAPVPAEIPLEVEAPAVPLSRADEEFVTGGMTQAEVLEKYELRPQALEQLDEVAERFPGHVETQESRVAMLRSEGDEKRLCDALVQLALARRAAGDSAGAVDAATEAASLGEFEQQARTLLERLSLLEADGPVALGDEVVSPPPPESQAHDTIEFESVVDLDGVDQKAQAPAPADENQPPPAAPRKPLTRVPSADMLEEIREDLDRGRPDEAHRRLQAIATLGYASPEMEQLARDVVTARTGSTPDPQPAPESPAPMPETEATSAPAEPTVDVEEGPKGAEAADADVELDGTDDLDAIRAVLEDELLANENEPVVPEEDPEQSMEEILTAFKDRVKDEVSADDHRTHYDLGIAYKEMGLIEEAIQEFRVALDSHELHCDACSMIALCHRDQEELAQAAEWYRRALDGPAEVSETIIGIRYDLAEVLLQAGDTQGALNEFRSVLEADPAFRDVRGRVTDLERQLGS